MLVIKVVGFLSPRFKFLVLVMIAAVLLMSHNP